MMILDSIETTKKLVLVTKLASKAKLTVKV